LSRGRQFKNRAFAFENSGYIIFGHSEARTEMLRRIADRYRRISSAQIYLAASGCLSMNCANSQNR